MRSSKHSRKTVRITSQKDPSGLDKAILDTIISTGQINNIIINNKDPFHDEKDQILSKGFKLSSHIHVDDTGARHNGQNGYCTHIGNDFFAWFKSTDSKSRINFLNLLRCEHTDLVLNRPDIPLHNNLMESKMEFSGG